MNQPTLFDKPRKQNKTTVFINPDIRLIERDNLKVLTVANYPVFSYDISDKESERYLIAQLSRNRIASQKILASCFNTHINTIKNYKNRLLRQGLPGLLYEKPDLKEPRKITPQVVREILAYYFRHSGASENEIAKNVSLRIGFSISHPSVGRVLEQSGFKLKGERPLAQPFKGVIDDRQLELGLFSPPTITQPAKLNEHSEEECTRADKLYLKRLKKGFFSLYGASLIYSPLISRFDLLNPYLAIYGKRDNKYISSQQVRLTFFYMVFLGFPSIESFKTARIDEFGPLIGRNCLPSVRSLRESLADFSSQGKSEDLILQLCQKFIEHGLASLGVLYIDGHYLPYFGLEPTLKSWSSVRRFAVKGNNQYFANDREQNPLFFIIRPPTTDLIRAIYEMIPLMRKITAKTLTLIFDRGGFSQEFFIKLRDDYPHVIFITWAEEGSFSIGKRTRDIDESLFKLFLVRLKTKKIKVKLAEIEIPLDEYGLIRTIVLLIPGSKKRIAILTNDTRDKKEIASLMINRWGQENFFKLMKKDYHIDYQPGYDTKEIESAPLIKNPQYNRTSKIIKKIKALITKAASELGNKTRQSKLKHQAISRLEEKNRDLLNKIYSLKTEKKRWLKKRGDIPKKISLKEAYLHQNMKELDLEKKAVLDSVKITAYNLQRYLIKFINRSVRPNNGTPPINAYDIIKQIANRGTKLKQSYNTLYVTMGYFNDNQIQKIAERLCEHLNTLSPVTLDKFAFNIRYGVEKQ